jgi:hypothetical protein
MSSAESVLKRKAEASNVPYRALLEVYKRGIGAWKTNPESVRLRSGEKNYSSSRAGKMGKEQWAMARVNAFLEKRGTVYRGSDNDVREKYGLK